MKSYWVSFIGAALIEAENEDAAKDEFWAQVTTFDISDICDVEEVDIEA